MDRKPLDRDTLDEDLAVAPPRPGEEDGAGGGIAGGGGGMMDVRPAIDASDEPRLQADPSDEDAKLDIAIDETFPGSDAPATTRPGHSEPAPSSGYDEEAEKKRV